MFYLIYYLREKLELKANIYYIKMTNITLNYINHYLWNGSLNKLRSVVHFLFDIIVNEEFTNTNLSNNIPIAIKTTTFIVAGTALFIYILINILVAMVPYIFILISHFILIFFH